MSTTDDDVRRIRYARAAGVGYLVIIATGIFAEFFVRASLVVSGDPGTTAANIQASELLFRSGLASEFVMLLADVFVAGALYVVFRPVDRGLAVLAASFRLVHAGVLGANLMNMYLPLLLLGGAGGAAPGMEASQAQGLALVLLEGHAFGYAIGLVFFAGHCALLGTLVLKSRYAPRILGVLLVVAAVGYLTDSLARALLLDYGAHQALLTTVVFLPAFVAELSFALWLVVRGVDLPPESGLTSTGPRREPAA